MADFHLLITDWFRQNCRDLPWRETNNPYHIWLSEIILQQTRVDQGLAYYQKFVRNYPTIFDLANASEQEVLRDWQGLGYYSRARNLHSTAKEIVQSHNGIFPSNYDSIIKLKGVGDYTASAIASIAFDLPAAVVDGNVYRVLSRYFDLDLPIDSTAGIKYFKELAQSLLATASHGTHNQALMEIGALVCKPANPDCDLCPLMQSCLAFQNNTIASRPVKLKKTKVRNRYFHYLVFTNGEQVVLEQRTEKDIWQNMYQFPLLETETNQDLSNFDFDLKLQKVSPLIVHLLSHQKIHARFYHFKDIPWEKVKDNRLIPIDKLGDFPIPRLIEAYLENNKLIH